MNPGNPAEHSVAILERKIARNLLRPNFPLSIILVEFVGQLNRYFASANVMRNEGSVSRDEEDTTVTIHGWGVRDMVEVAEQQRCRTRLARTRWTKLREILK